MKRYCSSFLLLLLGVSAGAWAKPPCWTLDGDSSLTFIGEQAGAPAHGEFKDFSVKFCFDPSAARGALDVSVALKSVDTRNDTRDDTLRGSEFFDVAQYPTAKYHADAFQATGDNRFRAKGTLQLHGVAKPVPVAFSFKTTDGGDKAEAKAEAKGEASLDRREFNVGQGRWSGTRWVGATVKLDFDLRLSRAKAPN